MTEAPDQKVHVQCQVRRVQDLNFKQNIKHTDMHRINDQGGSVLTTADTELSTASVFYTASPGRHKENEEQNGPKTYPWRALQI